MLNLNALDADEITTALWDQADCEHRRGLGARERAPWVQEPQPGSAVQLAFGVEPYRGHHDQQGAGPSQPKRLHDFVRSHER